MREKNKAVHCAGSGSCPFRRLHIMNPRTIAINRFLPNCSSGTEDTVVATVAAIAHMVRPLEPMFVLGWYCCLKLPLLVIIRSAVAAYAFPDDSPSISCMKVITMLTRSCTALV